MREHAGWVGRTRCPHADAWRLNFGPQKVGKWSWAMRYSRLNSFALFAAFCTLLLVMSGAAITSAHDRPKPALHATAGAADILLVGGLCIWLTRAGTAAGVARVGWSGLAVLLADAGLARYGTLHACLSAVAFVAVALIARFTSPSWQRDPEHVRDYGWPSLRFLSKATAFLVATQVGFGAGFRHRGVGVMPHLLGALLVAIFIMIVGAFVTTQFPKHPVLRPMAVAFMVISGVQVLLGFGVFLLRMVQPAWQPAFLAISVAHVAIGSLTFAFSVMLATEIQRTVLPPAPQTA
jgi:hypothetical protein